MHRTEQRKPVRGVALLIVLVMLGVIAFMSAAVMQSASSNEMVARNFRQQMLAQQRAESALRYCEAQLLLPDEQRVASLQEARLPAVDNAKVWTTLAAWNGVGSAGASVTDVPASFVWLQPASAQALPQCMVERRAGVAAAYRVTARGYSANYSRDSQGYTSTGMVSWLQTEVLIQPDDAGSLSLRSVRDRVWTRIVNMPFH